MGIKLKEIIIKHPISLKNLAGKIVAIDTFNMLYQFLSNIRARDGSLLTDSNGNITSHLIGIFSRCTNLINKGIKLVFVFDGKVPELKHKELNRRAELKKAAAEKYEQALTEQDYDAMLKFSSRTSRLTEPMINDAKKLITLLGMPYIQAPSEGEAQAAYMVKKGDAWAVISQDYDSLLFGATKLIQNVSIEGKRKIPGKFAFINIEPAQIELEENLKNLQINQEQFFWLAMLVGTDYNPSGVKGIGPKKGLTLIKQHPTAESLFTSVKLADDVDWKEVLNTLQNVPVTSDYTISWKPIDQQGLFDFLVKERDFSEERVNKFLNTQKKPAQKGLGEFL